MRKLSYLKSAPVLALFCIATAISTVAQTFTTLVTFDGNNGFEPISLIQGMDGNFYGTTYGGGKYGQNHSFPGDGTAFRMTPSGTITFSYSFCAQAHCADGFLPAAGLTQAPNQILYGTSELGGAGIYCNANGGKSGCGAIFKITSPYHVTNLYSFCSLPGCADGESPEEPLVQGFNGNFYGTTFIGGLGGVTCALGCGTVFEITPTGQLTTLHAFCENSYPCGDGDNSQAPLVVGTNGYIYGAANGGTSPTGTLFEITRSGKFFKIHQFNKATDGDDPTGLIQGTDGNLYGTAAFNGSGAFCSDTELCGTIFKVTPQGQFTTLYNFCSQANCVDGSGAYTGLIEASDGNFYGTTIRGGTNINNSVCFGPCGTIFKITPQGEFSTVYDFCALENCADGMGGGTLMQATDGKLYGTAENGGLAGGCRGQGCGTIFSLDLGLSPFVKLNPFFGKVGYKINILGNNLTETTGVTFNGTPATFTVVSDNYLKATVPSGATSGIIQVTSPSGTVSSHVQFQVIR